MISIDLKWRKMISHCLRSMFLYCLAFLYIALRTKRYRHTFLLFSSNCFPCDLSICQYPDNNNNNNNNINDSGGNNGNQNTHFFISNTFISNAQLKLAKIKQKLSNTLRINFHYLTIICFLHLRYHPEIIGDILITVQMPIASVLMRLYN